MTVLFKKTDAAPTQTDWERLRLMTDEDIARAVADDPDAAPIPTEEQLKHYKPTPARNKR
jgi:hypothetical protein